MVKYFVNVLFRNLDDPDFNKIEMWLEEISKRNSGLFEHDAKQVTQIDESMLPAIVITDKSQNNKVVQEWMAVNKYLDEFTAEALEKIILKVLKNGGTEQLEDKKEPR